MSGPLSEEELTGLLDQLVTAVDTAVRGRILAAVKEHGDRGHIPPCTADDLRQIIQDA